jgi:hypothetical protein
MTYRELIAALNTMHEGRLDEEVVVRRPGEADINISYAISDRGTDQLFLSDTVLGFGWDIVDFDVVND